MHKVLFAPWIRLTSQNKLCPNDPFNTFDKIMDLSEACGETSTFNFICGKTHNSFDADYQIDHPAIRRLMRHIHNRGHHLGLHPSYYTCSEPQLLIREAENLFKICEKEHIIQSEWGSRMHLLRWKWPTTLHGLKLSNLDYDSTLGFADRPGFRCGTCHPYNMFDPFNNRQINLIQRPLIVMEASITANKYLGLGFGSSALSKFQLLKTRCKSVRGNFELLWHNNNLVSPHENELFESILL